MKKIINKSHKVFSTSNAMKNEIVENFKRDDIQVIPLVLILIYLSLAKLKLKNLLLAQLKV